MDFAKISLSKAFFIIALSSVLNRVFTMLKDILVAREFGRESSIEMFLLSYITPYTISTIVGGAIGAAFIPLFFRAQKQKINFVSEIYFLTLFIGVALSVLLFLTFEPLMLFLNHDLSQQVFSENGKWPFLNLCWFLIPTLSSALLASYLNCMGYFAFPLLCFAISPAISVIALLWFPHSISALSIATLLGFFLEALSLLIFVNFLGHLKLFSFKKISECVAFIKASTLLLGGNILNSSAELIDKSMGGMLGHGNVAALEYGSRIPFGLGNFLRTSIGNFAVPRFSQAIAKKEFSNARKDLIHFILVYVSAGLVISLGVFYLSDWLISLIFQRGAFSPKDTQVVSHVQKILAFQLPVFIGSSLGMWMLVALQKQKLILFIAAICFIVNTLGNWFLMKSMGVIGISIATIIVYALSMILTLGFSFWKLLSH